MFKLTVILLLIDLFAMGNVEGGGPIDRDVFERMFQSMQHDLESSRHSNVQVERFKTGDRVVMHGLERVGLNGRFGLVLNPAPTADNRYHIRLEDTGDEVRAKKKNFTKIVTKPPHIIDVGEEEEGPTDTDQLLIGDCCVSGSTKGNRSVYTVWPSRALSIVWSSMQGHAWQMSVLPRTNP